jgi:hypothetical protein
VTQSRFGRRAAWRMLAVGALALLGTGVACKASPEAKAAAPEVPVDTTTPEPAEPIPVPVVAAPVEALRSTCDQYTIRDSGIGAVEVGDPHDALRTRCIVIGDSTADAGDGTVRGNLVVGVNGAPVVVQIADSRVYRLTVTDSMFRTMDGLGPGIPIVRMLDLPGAVVLEGEHDLSVVVGAHCGLYFRITKPAAPPENAARWADVVRALPAGTPVERVVVHGCR